MFSHFVDKADRGEYSIWNTMMELFMWFIEFVTLFLILGMFTLLLFFIGVMQILQTIFGFIMFILFMPFALISGVLRKIR